MKILENFNMQVWRNEQTQWTFGLTDVKREPYSGNIISGDG